MSSVITLLRVLPEFYEYGTGTLIWRLLYMRIIIGDCYVKNNYYVACYCAMPCKLNFLGAFFDRKLEVFLKKPPQLSILASKIIIMRELGWFP